MSAWRARSSRSRGGRTPSPCSPRPPCTTGSIPAPPVSATRWSSTSTRPVLADPEAPGQSVLEGAHVPAETSQRLACDATRQGHHIRHWAHGGPTTLSNLAMLCRHHHRAVHEEGYRVERHSDGALSFRRPDGRLLPDVPPLPAVSHDPSCALRTKNEAAGLRLQARTACPGWQGERLDVAPIAYTLATPSTSIRKSGWKRLFTTIRVLAGSSPWNTALRASATAGKFSIRVMYVVIFIRLERSPPAACSTPRRFSNT